MDAVSIFAEQLKSAHQIMEQTLEGVTNELADWTPPGQANPLGATYAHVVTAEDSIVNRTLRGGVPLFESSFADKLGLTGGLPGGNAGEDGWREWFRSVRVDLPVCREYARAVYRDSEEWVASLTVADLERSIDLSAWGLGSQTLAWILGTWVIWHMDAHCGEISCLKGLQGAKGYPF